MKSRLLKILIFVLAGIMIFINCKAEISETDFKKLRSKMVEQQIKQRGINDQTVLDAMLKVERHLFVPVPYRSLAYHDSPLPIGEDQTISQPYVVAFMTSVLNLKKNDRVLEIGTGSGYQAAIIAEIAEQVYTIEIVESLAMSSKKLLEELGYENITVKCDDGFKGWAEYAPFDAIILTCAPPEIPRPLLNQLRDGGRMIAPIGDIYQELKLYTKKDTLISVESVLPVSFVPMTGDSISIKKDR